MGAIITLTEFHKLGPTERMSAIKSGVQIVDETATEAQQRASQAAAARAEAIARGALPREQFDLMSPAERMNHVKSGLGIVD